MQITKAFINIIADTEYGIQEGFVLDSEKNEWYKYSKSGDNTEILSSWSDVLGLDLRTVI